jgi:hypothetical protein
MKENGVMFISITDNVLDKSDWPVVKLVLRGNEVVETKLVFPGIHSLNHAPSIGWNTRGIRKWLDCEPTTHPEVYHVWLEPNEAYERGFIDEYELADMLDIGHYAIGTYIMANKLRSPERQLEWEPVQREV